MASSGRSRRSLNTISAPGPLNPSGSAYDAHVLTFTESGEGHCLYTEAIELGSIGRLTMRRATTIEFDDASQQWEVRDAGGALLHTHPSREVCLAWEHRHFNQ